MSKNLETLLEDNWEEIKESVKSNWKKLSRQDVKQIEGSYDILIGKLKKAYGYTKDEIEEELDEFLSSEGIAELKYKVKNVKDEVENQAFSLKNTIEEYMRGYLQCIKEKTGELEENIITYAKENPMKILGIAALFSFALTKFLGSKK